MSQSRLDTSKIIGLPPDPINDIAPTMEMKEQIIRLSFELELPKMPEIEPIDAPVDQKLLEFFQAFVSRRYTTLSINPPGSQSETHEPPGESIHVITEPSWSDAVTLPSFETGAVQEYLSETDRENNLRNLVAMKANDAALCLYMAARLVSSSYEEMLIRINAIESAALDQLSGKPNSNKLSLVEQAAVQELTMAAQDLSMCTSNSKVVNMNSPRANARYIGSLACFMRNYTPELRENARVLISYTGDAMEATIYDLGAGAQEYVLQFDIKMLKRLQDPALRLATNSVINLGDFAQAMSKLNNADPHKNIIPLCRAASSDEKAA